MVDRGSPRLCVCVPARNEADRLPRLIDALAAQQWAGIIPVVVAVNNTHDTSLDVLQRCQVRHAGRLAIDVVTRDFPAPQAHAGSARRMAMDRGVEMLDGDATGVLVSTDADARPPADWLANIMAAVAGGADIVGGRIAIDPDEPLPLEAAKLHRALEHYWSGVRAIEDSIDPVAWDMPPRHGDHTGASLAITVRAYRDAGGVPLIATGEDRALVDAAVACGARLAHPCDVWVRVSSRRDGRASGGMAEAMAQLVAAGCGDTAVMVPDYAHWHARARWRRGLREQAHSAAQISREEARLAPMPLDMKLEALA